jgi:hypothetical protein
LLKKSSDRHNIWGTHNIRGADNLSPEPEGPPLLNHGGSGYLVSFLDGIGTSHSRLEEDLYRYMPSRNYPHGFLDPEREPPDEDMEDATMRKSMILYKHRDLRPDGQSQQDTPLRSQIQTASSAIMLGKGEDEVARRYRDLELRYCDYPALLEAFHRIDPRSLDAFHEIAHDYFQPGEYPAAESWYRRIAHEQVGISGPSNVQVSRSKAEEPPTDKMEDDETSDIRSLEPIAELPADELFINVPNVLGQSHSERKAIYSGNQDDLRSEPSNISAAPSIVSITDSIFSVVSGSSRKCRRQARVSAPR